MNVSVDYLTGYIIFPLNQMDYGFGYKMTNRSTKYKKEIYFIFVIHLSQEQTVMADR